MSYNRIGKGGIALGFAVLMLGVSSYGQNAAVSGDVAASGGVKFGVSGSLSKPKGTAVTSKDAKGMDQVEERVKGMQESIKKAVEQFQKANGSANDKLARLDSVLASINNSLAEIGDNGPIYQEIAKAVKTSEEQQKKYKDKVTDPKIEAKIREQYQKLADKIGKNINDLYERRIVLGKARADLEQRKSSITQQKDFIVDLMTADDISAANEALLQVIDSVKGVVQSIDTFAENIGNTPSSETAGKETR